MENGKNKYTFTLSDSFLSNEECDIFTDCLSHYGLDESIWDVFSSLFKAGLKNTTPLVLKAYKDNSLYGLAILVKCKNYGKSLFSNKILSGLVNFIKLPYFQWIKFGCCMDMMSNPGFVVNPEKSDEVFKAMFSFLKRNNALTIINDYSENIDLYENASVLPALPHALIDCTSILSLEDYSKKYKNIKRKIKVFTNKKGSYERVENQLTTEQLNSLKKCFVSTAEKSMFYLPYQELYLNAAITTSSIHIKNVHYFIARIDGEFIGYQAALLTGKHLNALHGAFDRNRKSTYHAYDILFLKMTEFALENGLESIDFGAVINYTKEKMVNRTRAMSYFIFSKYSFLQKAFTFFLGTTKIQGTKLMKFRS